MNSYDLDGPHKIPSGIALPNAIALPGVRAVPMPQQWPPLAPVVTNTPRPGDSLDELYARARLPLPVKKPDPTPAKDVQVGGDHYTKLPIQVFEFTMSNKLDPMQHTIIKYVTRFRDKGGLEDLKKARHTIDLLIEHDYGVQSAS
jgi:hypothetical protein